MSCTPALVPGQPLNFKAEPESETSILLSWTPPRSDTISNYDLVYKDGEHGEEVSQISVFFKQNFSNSCKYFKVHYITKMCIYYDTSVISLQCCSYDVISNAALSPCLIFFKTLDMLTNLCPVHRCTHWVPVAYRHRLYYCKGAHTFVLLFK